MRARINRPFSIALLFAVFIFFAAAQICFAQAQNKASITKQLEAVNSVFIPNVGQVPDANIEYFSRTGKASYYFSKSDVICDFNNNILAVTLKIAFENSNKNCTIKAQSETKSRFNYYTGNDRSKWKTDVPSYSNILYKNLYDGIDLRYELSGTNIKSTYSVSRKKDPKQILVRVEGVDSLSIDKNGNLVYKTKSGEITEQKPYAYQEIAGKRQVISVSYKIISGLSYTFDIGRYDPNSDLLIDPVLNYSTYFGSSADDYGYSIAVDSSGNAYLAGSTSSLIFPRSAGRYQASRSGQDDVFFTKLNADGSDFIYSTYIGGDDFDTPYGITVDASGIAYLVGSTLSTDFPCSVGAYQSSNAGIPGTLDIFVVKIAPTNLAAADLIYSTYLGGGGDDIGESITTDLAGNIILRGVSRRMIFQ